MRARICEFGLRGYETAGFLQISGRARVPGNIAGQLLKRTIDP